MHVTRLRVFDCVVLLFAEANDQIVPSHRAMRGCKNVPLPKLPTAQHCVIEEHATPLNESPVEPELGDGITVQANPSHCSISVCCTPVRVALNPTAKQSDDEKHPTPRMA